MKILVTPLHSDVNLPRYQTPYSAAMDIEAYLAEPRVLQPMERAIIPTGLTLAIPEGYEVQIRARSGLSIKHGICLANGVGTIDADYRGELGILIINLGQDAFTVEPGMRIAQMVLAKYEVAEWRVVDELPETERGTGGYGSTGIVS